MGHARTLVSLPSEEEQLIRFNQIIDEQLSVRDIESIVKNGPTKNSTALKQKPQGLNSSQKTFKEFLSDRLSSKISIQKSDKGNGKIAIHFDSESDLNRIIELLKR